MPAVTRKRQAKTEAPPKTTRRKSASTTPKAQVRAATKRTAAKSNTARKTTAAKATTRPTNRATKTSTPAPATAKVSSNGNGGYSRHEYQPFKLTEVLKRIKAGEAFTVLARDYGATAKVRRLLAEKGYDTAGKKIELTPINGNGQVLAKRIIKAREANKPWYELSIQTGKSERDLKALIAEHGRSDLAYGRVRRDGTIVGNVNGKPAKQPTPKASTRKTTTKAPAKRTVAKTEPTPTPAGTKRPTHKRKVKPAAETPRAARKTTASTKATGTASKRTVARKTAHTADSEKVTPITAAKGKGARRVGRRKAAADPSPAV